jgi:hypothetical protein
MPESRLCPGYAFDLFFRTRNKQDLTVDQEPMPKLSAEINRRLIASPLAAEQDFLDSHPTIMLDRGSRCGIAEILCTLILRKACRGEVPPFAVPIAVLVLKPELSRKLGYFNSYPQQGNPIQSGAVAGDWRFTRANVGGRHAKPEKEQRRAAK